MVLIIAEIGVNHNGCMNTAKKLIEVAVQSGADIVKFQTFKSDELTTDIAPLAEYQLKNSLNLLIRKSYLASWNLVKKSYFIKNYAED